MLTQQKLHLWLKPHVSDSPVRSSASRVGSAAPDRRTGTTHCSWQSPGLPNRAVTQAGVFMVKLAELLQMNHCQRVPEQAHWRSFPLPAARHLQSAAVQASHSLLPLFHPPTPSEKILARGKMQHPAREKRMWMLGLHGENVSSFTNALDGENS